jgi:tRNA-splicing ligase RtcB
LTCELSCDELAPLVPAFVHELSRSIPTGYGRSGRLVLRPDELDTLLEGGCRSLIRNFGYGEERDLELVESGGCLDGASSTAVSERAKQRGHDQLGTLGGGNHFIEVQKVAEIFDPKVAERFGLSEGGTTVLIHTGSRGLGHQVCADYVQLMDEHVDEYGYELPDRQLACAPLSSPEGRSYFAAMCAAANFAFCNRQLITYRARQVLERVAGRPVALDLLYDLAHNTAKIETFGHTKLCVHRKGATRAFGPSASDLPAAYRGVGQPVLIPGSMGTTSFVLVGTDESAERSLGSACHGAGRAMSRGAAKRAVVGHVLRKELEKQGVFVRCPSNVELAEEAPVAYKDVERVVEVVHGAGLARKVARLVPLGVVKG